MTDLYDQRVDAMKARERIDGPRYADGTRWYERRITDPVPVDGWALNIAAQERRNADRLVAYKRKRARYNRDMYIVETAADEVYD